MENVSFTAARLVSVSAQHSPSGTPFISTLGQPHATVVHLLTTPDKTQTALGGMSANGLLILAPRIF